MKLVLLHSPLSGPGTWRLLGPALAARRYDVAMPDFRPAMQGGGPYYRALSDIARDVSLSEPVTFIAHSGAGALVPSMAEGLNASAIFIDALLPHPGRCWFETTSETLRINLIARAENGLLPAWHRWWPHGAIQNLIGNEAVYEAFADELNPLPMSYFTEIAPSASNLPPARCAYLQLSEGYTNEAGIAEANGWRTQRAALNHLAMLSAPDVVAELLEREVQALAD